MTSTATSLQQKAQKFQDLHATGTFVIPNFWDVGSAVILERLGFQALASTSAGFANAIGKLDGQVTLAEKLAHLQAAAAATTAPISADFECGFADAPAEVAANILAAAQTGIVGASIEDWSGAQIYDLNHAVERIAACAEAIAGLDFPFALTARSENLIRGVNDLDDTINRLQAYEEAGADVLYAPGLASSEQIQAVLSAVNKPINVLFAYMPDKPFDFYAQLGVRRISLGGALANHAIGATLSAARRMLEDGDFTWATEGAPRGVINQLLS